MSNRSITKNHNQRTAQHPLGCARKLRDGPGLVAGRPAVRDHDHRAALGALLLLIGRFSLWPFGQEAMNREELSGRGDLGTGPLGLIGNVLWFLVAGWWLAIGHLSSALACFVSIVGIPFGIQHIKLALIALKPVGMTVVPVRSAG